MPDVAHTFGSDLTLGPGGDIATSDGSQLGQERVLRRLLTNPSDYIWHLEYGAGLPSFIGQPTNKPRIAAITRAQMFLESVVARNPAPLITVDARSTGVVTETIVYADAPTGQQQVLTFNLTA